MGEKYSKEEHDKCKKVAEAFRELYDMLGDTCVLDAGEFGYSESERMVGMDGN